MVSIGIHFEFLFFILITELFFLFALIFYFYQIDNQLIQVKELK